MKKPIDRKYLKTKLFFDFKNKKGELQREFIELENFYIDALDSIGVKNWSLFITEIVSDEWISKTGNLSLLNVVKSAIVKVIQERMQEIKPTRTYTDRFNAKNTAFDVLTDYAFGGDKQAALDYLKTL
jgi:hypothetical protein